MEDPSIVDIKRSQPATTEQPKQNYASYLSIAFWSEYFDVTQTEILERVTTALHPSFMNLGSNIKSKPELYGPFWICSTIVFCLFAFGNLSSFMVGHAYNYEYISSATSLLYGLIEQLFVDSACVDVFCDEDAEYRWAIIPCLLIS